MALAHVAGKYRVPCKFEFLKFASPYPFPTALYKSDARFAGRHSCYAQTFPEDRGGVASHVDTTLVWVERKVWALARGFFRRVPARNRRYRLDKDGYFSHFWIFYTHNSRCPRRGRVEQLVTTSGLRVSIFFYRSESDMPVDAGQPSIDLRSAYLVSQRRRNVEEEVASSHF